jgi:hypothetical protein
MKRLFLIVFTCGLLSSADAQIYPGTILVGGSSSGTIQSTKLGSSSQTLFNVNTRLGYFIAENLAIGFNFNYINFGSIDQTSIGAFGRYYVSGKYFLGANFLGSKSVNSTTSGSVNFEGGYAAFLTDNIAIEPAIVYSTGVGDSSNSSSIGFAVGFSLYLNRKKIK